MTEATLLGAIAGTPWAMLAPALQTILEVAQRENVDPRNLDAWKAAMAPARQEAVAFRASPMLPGARLARLRDGVAILPVAGPIFRHANLMTDLSGATALGSLASDLALARDDGRVRAILLELDSPGGQLTGLAEVAAAIRAAADVKPVVAYVDGLAASAAYLLGAAASEMVLARSATVGSLGVVGVFPPANPTGKEPVEIVSSQTPGKRASPHTDEGRARLQSWIDRSAEEFLAQVAELRGMEVAALLDATGGGGLLIGRDAVAAGLADSLGSFEETLARLASGAGPVSPRRPAATTTPLKGTLMSDPTPAPAADPTPAAPPVPVAALPAAPPAPAADPVAQERARTAAIMAAQQPGMGALAQLAVAQGWSPEVFAQAQAASATAIAQAQTAAFKASLPAPIAGGQPADPASLPPAERAKAEFDADPNIRAEFGSVGTYAAFLTAQAAGRVRVLSRGKAA